MIAPRPKPKSPSSRPGSRKRGSRDGARLRWSRASATARSRADCRSRARSHLSTPFIPFPRGGGSRWERDKPEATLTEYGRTTEGGEAAERWRASVFFSMLSSGDSVLRRRIPADGELEFPAFAQLREAKISDCGCVFHRLD